MAPTLREMDNAAEAAISGYLDTYFYPFHTTNCMRYTDRDTQMLGIDVKFDIGDLTGILVDEKALTHYVNKNLPTFAFEIDFLSSSKQLIPGWLYDDKKLTQYYLLSWITAKKDKDISTSDITRLDTLLISRMRIIEMLAAYGINRMEAERIATDLRRNNVAGAFHREPQKPFYFYFSPQLAEAPVNIIIHRAKLVEMATSSFIIEPR